MTVGSLFSGIEGFGIGLEWAGMITGEPVEIKWQVEIDEWCRDRLAEQWLEAERFSDVKEVGKHNLGAVDLICGGPPCQPVSVAGKRAGKEDDRWLWDEALRIVAETLPSWVVFENPPGILGMAQFDSEPPVDGEGNPAGDIGDVYTRVGRGYTDEILETLKALGYEVEVFNIPACGVGAVHRRERVWIVAHRDGRGSRGETGNTGIERRRCSNSGASDLSEQPGREPNAPIGDFGATDPDVCHSERGGLSGESRRGTGQEFADGHVRDETRTLADRECGGAPQPQGSVGDFGRRAEYGGENVPNSELHGLQGCESAGRETPGMRRRSSEQNCADVSDAIGKHGDGTGYDAGSIRRERREAPEVPGCQDVPDTDRAGQGEQRRSESGGAEQSSPKLGIRRFPQPRLGISPDGISSLIAGWPHVAPLGMAQYDFEPPRLAGKFPDRAKWLKAMGNAVVPLVPMVIGCMIIGAERREE